MRKTCFGTLAVLALAGSSCGGNGLYPVCGKVTYQGAPAAGASVHLRRPGAESLNQHMLMGVVQEDGSFTIYCGDVGKGAPPGDYDVLILWRQSSQQAKGGAPKATDKLQGRYADPSSPRWRVAIKAENNELPTFELAD
jgi:hypothetical protein